MLNYSIQSLGIYALPMPTCLRCGILHVGIGTWEWFIPTGIYKLSWSIWELYKTEGLRQATLTWFAHCRGLFGLKHIVLFCSLFKPCHIQYEILNSIML